MKIKIKNRPPMQTPPTIPKFKTQFNHIPASSRDLICEQPSLTDQSFKQEADINHLMARYRQCGSFYNPLDPVRHNRPLPQFGDFSALPDLSSAIITVAHAQEMFARLPAEIREACNHDPAAFLALQKNPEMQDLLTKYGLIEKKTVPPAQPEPEPVKDA